MYVIHDVNGGSWYLFFYLISSVLTYLFLLYLGWKKGYPLLSWILILVSGALFFIIGTKIITFGSEEWTTLFREGIFPDTANKSAIGGMLFAILGIELSRLWLKRKEFVLDTYVLMVPLGLALQKPGCLLAGCCFGTQTTLPWGVQYAQGTAIHYHQWASNIIPASEVLSLPVHPVPIYEMIGYLMIFGALILLAPYLQKRGSRFLLAITLLAVSRFSIEFFRDAAATQALGQMIWGLKAIQWVLLAIGLMCGLIFLRIMKRPSVSKVIPPEINDLMWRKFTLILLLSLVMWTVHKGFSATEMLVMNLKILPALVLFGIHAWIRFTVTSFRLAGVVILILPLIIMGQSLPGKEMDWTYFHSFGAGGTFGSFGQAAGYNEHEGGCNGVEYDYKYYQQRFGMATLNYNYTKQSGYRRFTYGGSLFGGINKEKEVDIPGTSVHYIFGLHPYMDFNFRWVGFGFGASFGPLKYFPTTVFDEKTIDSGLRSFPVLPSLKFRVGPYDIIDLEYKFQDEFPTQLPFSTHQLSLGSGFGMENGSGLRVGFVPPYEGVFFSANALINKKIMIQAKYIYTSSSNHTRFGNNNFISFGLNYRLAAQPKISNLAAWE
jgi:prolipoprotein diacylglyceryltransferase